MKIRKAKSTTFLIPLFLSSVISEHTFTYPIDKHRRNHQSNCVRKSLPVDKQPSYSQMCRRTNKLNIDINGSIYDDFVIIATDSTGIKVTNRGLQWMQDKWIVKNKKGYLKIHLAGNIDYGIVALEVTDEKVHNSKVMEKIVSIYLIFI